MKIRMFLAVLMSLICRCSYGETVYPSANMAIKTDFFGFHAHRLLNQTPWPGKYFSSYRLWDAKVRWADIERMRNYFDFSRLDVLVRNAGKYNKNILLPLGMPPSWASSRPKEPSAYNLGEAAMPAKMSYWESYVTRVVTRYKGKVEAYEIWNEPNLPKFFSGTAEDAVVLTCSASQIIKRIDPAAKVISPAPLGDYGVVWLAAFFEAGGGKCADVIGYHFYNQHKDPETHIAIFDNIMKLQWRYNISLPVWNTETGWLIESKSEIDATAVGFQESDRVLSYSESASILTRAYIIQALMGVQRFYWYALDNDMMGLLENGGSGVKKPAYKAYETTARFLIGNTIEQCKEAASAWLCTVLNPKGERAYAAWHTNEATEINDINMSFPYYYVPGRGQVSKEKANQYYRKGEVVFYSSYEF